MNHFHPFARAIGMASFVLALASACGGKSFNGGDTGDAGTGGAVSRAGNSSAGSSSAGRASGGSGSSAGSSSAGRASGGSGSGGSPDEPCSGPSEVHLNGSSCTASLTRWTHEPTTGLCRPTFYGGCGATKNNYETLEDCQRACPGGTPNFDACQAASDCVLTAMGCCGVCSSPNVTSHDLIAYNRQNADQFSSCAGDVACGVCPPPERQDTLKYFSASCVAGECAVEDLRQSDLSACTTSEDCRLRLGSGCCESCSSSEVVAVRNDGSFEAQVCGGLMLPCLACEAVPPSDAVANCDPTGHCEVTYLLK